MVATELQSAMLKKVAASLIGAAFLLGVLRVSVVST
jgi:hypothetical protein